MGERDVMEDRAITVPISVCKACDRGRDPLDVPDEPCGHDPETHRRTVGVKYVPAERLRGAVETLREVADWIDLMERPGPLAQASRAKIAAFLADSGGR